jgi:hypothetical protein
MSHRRAYAAPLASIRAALSVTVDRFFNSKRRIPQSARVNVPFMRLI